MGAAAYRRGSVVIARQADMDVGVAVTRTDRQALRDENERLRLACQNWSTFWRAPEGALPLRERHERRESPP